MQLSLEARIEVLERANRRQRRVLFAIVLGGVPLALLGAGDGKSQPDWDLVRARRVEIVDKEGAARIVMGIDDEDTSRLFGPNTRVVITSDKQNGGTIVCLKPKPDAHGFTSGALRGDQLQASAVRLFEGQEERITMGAHGGVGVIVVTDGQKRRTTVGVNTLRVADETGVVTVGRGGIDLDGADGQPRLGLGGGADGGWLFMYDSKGKSLLHAGVTATRGGGVVTYDPGGALSGTLGQ